MVQNEHKRSEHHGEIPIIYSAIGTATVSQKPRMEGTEKENADHVTYAICKAYEEENAHIEYLEII